MSGNSSNINSIVGPYGQTFIPNIPNVNIDSYLPLGQYVAQRSIGVSGSALSTTALNRVNQSYIGMAAELQQNSYFAGVFSTDTINIPVVINTFFSHYNTFNKLPLTASGFFSAFLSYANTGGSSSFTSTQAEQGFLNEYLNMLGITPTPSSSQYNGGDLSSFLESNGSLSGDWGSLGSLTQGTIGSSSNASDSMVSQFESAFSQFLQSYSYNQSQSNPNGQVSASDFMNQWYQFMTGTAAVSNSATLRSTQTTNTTQTTTTQATQVPTYELVYSAYFPGSSQSDFQTMLQGFYQQQITANGYFNPSQSFSAWVQYVQGQAGIESSGTAFPMTTVDTSATAQVQVLNRIFALLVAMIQTLQNVTAAQADRLNFLSNWQTVYTNVINQIKTFTEGDSTYIGTGNATSSTATIRNNLNQLNQTYVQQLTANRNIINTQAQSEQSNISSGQDAITQQTDLATAIIQQSSTLIGSIFR